MEPICPECEITHTTEECDKPYTLALARFQQFWYVGFWCPRFEDRVFTVQRFDDYIDWGLESIRPRVQDWVDAHSQILTQKLVQHLDALETWNVTAPNANHLKVSDLEWNYTAPNVR